MTVRYPNGMKRQKYNTSATANQFKSQYSNRGMTLEEDINVTNKFYLDTNKAIIYKKPTPIQIVNVHYPKRSAAVITEGYFQAKSTTDFNGLYRGEYIDFEAKETKNKTRFPLANIHEHQLNHMKQIVQHGGICFMIIRFTVHNETYLLQADKLFQMIENRKDTLKSLPYKTITQAGYEIPLRYPARVDYLPIIDQLYF